MNTERKANSTSQTGLATEIRDYFASGVIVVDTNQRICAITPEAGQMAGVNPAEVVNQDYKVLPQNLRRMVAAVLESGEQSVGRRLAGASDKTTVNITAVPLSACTPRSGVVLVLNSLDASRHLEQKLGRLDRLAGLGTLSAGMAHEIKNALVSVKTFVDLLLEQNRDAELADVVKREMGRMSALASQTLKFAAPSRRALATIRLHEVLEHSLRMVHQQLQSRLITLHRSLNAQQDTVHADTYQIEQVLVNILLNAIEAMASGGTLTVTTEIVSAPAGSAAPESAFIRLSITDTGVGIQQENMNRLFEPFFTTKENGTGLGLAIARRIIREHRGDITIQSDVGRGTTINVLLPAQPAS